MERFKSSDLAGNLISADSSKLKYIENDQMYDERDDRPAG